MNAVEGTRPLDLGDARAAREHCDEDVVSQAKVMPQCGRHVQDDESQKRPGGVDVPIAERIGEIGVHSDEVRKRNDLEQTQTGGVSIGQRPADQRDAREDSIHHPVCDLCGDTGALAEI